MLEGKMKKLVLATALIAILLSAGFLAGCDRVPIGEAGDEITRDFQFADFTGIEVQDAFELDVSYAETYSVTVTAPENVMERIDVSKSGDTLKIELDGWWWFWSGTPKAEVTLPVLRSLDISGATRADVRGFRSGEDFTLGLSGASQLDIDMEAGDFDGEISGASKLIGYMETGEARVELSGASEIRLTGSTENLILDGSGASQVNLEGYSITDADIELSGASRGEVEVSGRLDVGLSGASNLEYSGDPDLGRVDVTGASSLEEKED